MDDAINDGARGSRRELETGNCKLGAGWKCWSLGGGAGGSELELAAGGSSGQPTAPARGRRRAARSCSQQAASVPSSQIDRVDRAAHHRDVIAGRRVVLTWKRAFAIG